MKRTYRHISHEEAHAELEADHLFGPTYHARQLHLAAERASAQAAAQENSRHPYITMPGEKRSAAQRWPESSKLRGKRVLADLALIDDTYRELVGDATLQRPAIVKQVMNGYARLAWGVTEAWLSVEALAVVLVDGSS